MTETEFGRSVQENKDFLDQYKKLWSESRERKLGKEEREWLEVFQQDYHDAKKKADRLDSIVNICIKHPELIEKAIENSIKMRNEIVERLERKEMPAEKIEEEVKEMREIAKDREVFELANFLYEDSKKGWKELAEEEAAIGEFVRGMGELAEEKERKEEKREESEEIEKTPEETEVSQEEKEELEKARKEAEEAFKGFAEPEEES